MVASATARSRAASSDVPSATAKYRHMARQDGRVDKAAFEERCLECRGEMDATFFDPSLGDFDQRQHCVLLTSK